MSSGRQRAASPSRWAAAATARAIASAGNPVSQEIRCHRKSGVRSSFLPEKMNRHRITPLNLPSVRRRLRFDAGPACARWLRSLLIPGLRPRGSPGRCTGTPACTCRGTPGGSPWRRSSSYRPGRPGTRHGMRPVDQRPATRRNICHHTNRRTIPTRYRSCHANPTGSARRSRPGLCR